MLFALVTALTLSVAACKDEPAPAANLAYTAANPNFLYYTNPIVAERADPYIMKHTDGYYYMMASVPEYDRLELRRSPTLSGLAYAEPKVIFEKNETGLMSKNLWAPEIHYLDGSWYAYFSAARTNAEFDHRMYVLENTSPNPMEGEFVMKDRLRTGAEVFQIDVTVFEHRGVRYAAWSGAASKGNSIYIATMSNPWTIGSGRALIAEPEYPWEVDSHVPVVEGPQFFTSGDKVYLAYSGGFCDARYTMGLLTASAESDLLDPASWTKSSEPVFQSDPSGNAYGPGHGSFTLSPDGTERIMVYHGVDAKTGVGCDRSRNVRIQPYTLDAAGAPVLGQPVSRGTVLPAPSGENRFEAERTEEALAGRKAAIVQVEGASAGQLVQLKSGTLTFTDIVAPATGVYELTIGYQLPKEQAAVKQQISVNGGKWESLEYTSSTGGLERVSRFVELKGGPNTIAFKQGNKEAGIDYIELDYPIIEAENGGVGGVETAQDPKASQGQYITMFGSEASMEVERSLPKAGRYTLAVQYRLPSASAAGGAATPVLQDVRINEASAGSLSYAAAGDVWGWTSLEVELKEGANKIILGGTDGAVHVDRLQLVPSLPAEATFKLKNRLTGTVLDLVNGSEEEGASLYTYRDAGFPAHEWSFEYRGKGYFTIRNNKSGLYLERDSSGELRQFSAKSEDSQHWKLEYAGYGTYRILNKANGQALELVDGNPADRAKVGLAEFAGKANQLWMLDYVQTK